MDPSARSTHRSAASPLRPLRRPAITPPALSLAVLLVLGWFVAASPLAGQVPGQAPGQAPGQPADAPAPSREPAPGDEDEPVPAQRATPRATMMSFLEAFYQDEGLQQAVAALDLSEVPEALHSVKGPELAVQLKEVLDRTRLIEPEEIPDDPRGEPYVFLSRPAGEVVIDRQESGEWLFTAETVATLPDLYLAVEDQEVVEGVEQVSTALSPGLWLRSQMPRSLKRTSFILEAWQWLGLLVLILVGLILDRLAVALAQLVTRRWLEGRFDAADSAELRKSLRPLGIVVMALLWKLGLPFLLLPVNVHTFLEVAVRFVLAAGAVWTAYRLVDILSAVLSARAARTENRFDDLLVPLVRRSLKVFIAAFGIVFVADTTGIEVSSLLAGLGLGGLAVALAAQDAVKNLFGSLTILVDRPFSVGDWVVIGDIEGIVEDVGFRSVRIRTFYNSLITLPNSNLISAAVDNYGARQYRRWSTTLSIAYDTPPERVDAFCEGIRELVRHHRWTWKDGFQIYLSSFGDSALEVLVYVFFEVPDWSTELASRHELGLDILRLGRSLGVEFAFPTRTVWLRQAGGGEVPELSGEAPEDGRSAAGRIPSEDAT